MQRAVRIVVLGNAAAGAEKQALALGARLRDRLLPLPRPPEGRASLTADSVRCVRVPLRSDSIAHRLPPLLHVAAAVATRDPFFGYDLSDAAKAHLWRRVTSADVSAPPPPLRVVIGCGRTTVALCATLKRMAHRPSDVFNIQIQHPRVPLSWFDAVVAPRHDFSPTRTSLLAHTHPQRLHLTTGTVHDISSDLLELEAEQWRSELSKYVRTRRVRIAWLIGGPCRGFAFTPEDARAMTTQFVQAVRRSAALSTFDEPAVFVTFSRRTPAKVVEIIERELRASFADLDQLFVWNGVGRNPYHAFLALATAVVTTPDSISMTTEAIASAKAVFTISVDRAQGKFRRFHEALFAAKLAAPLTSDALTTATLAAETAALSSSELLQTPSTSSETLERELSGIADSIARQIRDRGER